MAHLKSLCRPSISSWPAIGPDGWVYPKDYPLYDCRRSWEVDYEGGWCGAIILRLYGREGEYVELRYAEPDGTMMAKEFRLPEAPEAVKNLGVAAPLHAARYETARLAADPGFAEFVMRKPGCFRRLAVERGADMDEQGYGLLAVAILAALDARQG